MKTLINEEAKISHKIVSVKFQLDINARGIDYKNALS